MVKLDFGGLAPFAGTSEKVDELRRLTASSASTTRSRGIDPHTRVGRAVQAPCPSDLRQRQVRADVASVGLLSARDLNRDRCPNGPTPSPSRRLPGWAGRQRGQGAAPEYRTTCFRSWESEPWPVSSPAAWHVAADACKAPKPSRKWTHREYACRQGIASAPRPAGLELRLFIVGNRGAWESGEERRFPAIPSLGHASEVPDGARRPCQGET